MAQRRTDRAVDELRDLARAQSCAPPPGYELLGVNASNTVARPTLAQLAAMPISDAVDQVLAEVRSARAGLEEQLALTATDDEPDRSRRMGLIRDSLARLAESEARLIRTARLDAGDVKT